MNRTLTGIHKSRPDRTQTLAGSWLAADGIPMPHGYSGSPMRSQ